MSATLSSERQRKKLAQKEANQIKKRLIDKVKTSNVAFNLDCLVDSWLELESDPGTFSLLIEDFGCFGAQVEEIYDLDQKFDSPVLGFIFLFKWLNNNHQTPSDRSSRNQKSNSFSNTINNSTNTDNNNENNCINEATSTADVTATTTTTTRTTKPIAPTTIKSNANALTSTTTTQDKQQKQLSCIDEDKSNSKIFFAKQMISNSCATHALISILLNCDYHGLNLGPSLSRLKELTKPMNPETKGYAIGNLPELAKAHNSHASFSSLYNKNKLSHNSSGMSYIVSGNQRTNLQLQNKHEAYHFVSYVPINNRLYELDGLKEEPIDHGPFDPKKEDWTEKFKRVIKERLLINNKSEDDTKVSNEIRYSLMAVVPDRRVILKKELKKLEQTRAVVQENIDRISKRVHSPATVEADIPNPPYSPLSNGTMTASETGSRCNSPECPMEDEFLFDNEEGKIDKYVFIKFDKRPDTTNSTKNSQPAHKNCIINIDPTGFQPVNLTKDEELTNHIEDVEINDCKQIVTNHQSDNDIKADNNITNKAPNKNNNPDHEHLPIDELQDQEMIPIDNEAKLVKQETEKTCSPKEDDVKLEPIESQTNGAEIKTKEENEVIDEVKVNEILAHNDEKLYNLSNKPPFDFNILDDMQHVHIGKSTLKDMRVLLYVIQSKIVIVESSLKEENDKRRKYKIDNSRRTHNYEPFIITFLSLLAKQGNLADLIEKDLGIVSETDQSNQQSSPTVATRLLTELSTSKTQKSSNCTTRLSNGGNSSSNNSNNKANAATKTSNPSTPSKQARCRYVSTGRPVGRPRKNPLDSPVQQQKSTNSQ